MDDFAHFDKEALFNRATAYVASGTFEVSVSDRLYFYSRYKQATEGPCTVAKPGFFDMQGRKKWEAWTSVQNLTKEQAKEQYISKLNEIDPNWESLAPIKTGWVSVSTMMKEPPCDPSQKDIFDYVKENDLAKVMTYSLDEIVRLDENGMTPLHWACDRGHIEMAQYLLKVGSNVNAQDSEGQTPLHYASSCSHETIVKNLLESGADVNSKDFEGLCPFDCAEEESIKALLKR